MRILGTGSAHPKLTVTNQMLEQQLDTSDEWIVTRTGIRRRQIISSEHLDELAATACRRALDNAGLHASDIDYIICSNVINEYVSPGLSCLINEQIEASCPCVDLNGACTGFIYALDVADSILKSRKNVRNILICCAEEPTRMVDWNQRNTCVLFGDGAGAVVVSDGDDLMAISLSTQSKHEALYQKNALMNTPFLTEPGIGTPLTMHGQDVFKMAVSSSYQDIQHVLEETGMTKDEVDFYLLHQANIRIINHIREQMNLADEKFPVNLDKYGNTSSASIPMLLDELNQDHRLKSGDILVFSAFGAGFTTGACMIRWSKSNVA